MRILALGPALLEGSSNLPGSCCGAGRAILGMQGSRPVLVAAGEPIADGVQLHEVHADHVIVLRQGMPERLELERRASRASPPPASVRPPAPK